MTLDEINYKINNQIFNNIKYLIIITPDTKVSGDR
jgi:hypothetical protein